MVFLGIQNSHAEGASLMGELVGNLNPLKASRNWKANIVPESSCGMIGGDSLLCL